MFPASVCARGAAAPGTPRSMWPSAKLGDDKRVEPSWGTCPVLIHAELTAHHQAGRPVDPARRPWWRVNTSPGVAFAKVTASLRDSKGRLGSWWTKKGGDTVR